MNYDFDLDIHYLNFTNFKQKQVSIFRHILEGSRLNKDFAFSGYALITTDEEDKHHIHPHIEETENFNRIKTNCLVYDIINPEEWGYHKCFVYQNLNAKGNGFFGYLLWNEDSKKLNHVWNIEHDEGAFCRRLNKTASVIRHKHKYLPYEV